MTPAAPLPADVLSILGTLRAAGFEALLAGGCVRDRLLGRPVSDYDIATSARPEEIERLFPSTIPVGRAFGVILVVQGGPPREVATFRRDGRYLDGRRPESVAFSDAGTDAKRRDFTINGLFLDPEKDEVLDFVGGRRDLDARIIRAIGDPAERFGEDALRLLRAVRFTAQLGFAIDPATEKAVGAHAAAIRKVSAERIRQELAKILASPGRVTGLEGLHRTGLLREILPEVAAMEGVGQPPEYHPEGDVWTHTKLAMGHLLEPSFEVAMGTLLHDVGKPVTMTKTDRIRFNGHDKIGARMAREIGRRLKLSNEEIDEIEWLVDRHLVFLNWPGLRQSTLKRLFADPRFDHLMEVVRADTLGSMADTAYIEEILAARRAIPAGELKPPPLLTGHDLIRMGYKPGPTFKEALAGLQEARLEGRISDREGAIEWVTRRLGRPTS